METTSKGDPRVLFVMNLVLSALFASIIVWGVSYVDVAEFTVINVASLTLVLMAVTYVVTY